MNINSFKDPKMKVSIISSIIASVITAVVVSSIFLAVNNPYSQFGTTGGGASNRTDSNFFSNFYAQSNESSVIDVIKRANPAVVSITISKNVPVIERYFIQRNPYGDIFDFPLPQVFPQYRQKGTEKREVGGGSGFLVSADGYIVTNKHVVDDPEAEYTIFTNDGKKHEAKLIAVDPSLDIAILKISGNSYAYLEFIDSEDLQIGQSVIAIGNALGEFRNTVSVGVVSGLGRSIVAGGIFDRGEVLDELIQTDAAINQGNSGGPLLDLHGRVVGVNVAVASGAENIGFALPASSIREVVESVRTHGKIIRAYIGVRYVAITPELKTSNKLSVDYGVLVARGQNPDDPAILPGSPADKAGIIENDIILEVNGEKITAEKGLSAIVRTKKPGDVISLKILRNGAERKLNVRLEEIPQTM